MKYYERQFCPWVLIALAIFALIILIPKDTAPFWIKYYFFPALFALFLFIFINFFYLKIRIDDQHLVFGFGLLRQKIALNDISVCKPFRVKFGNYWGYGIRYGWDRSLAYSIRDGASVKVILKNKKAYVFNTRHPEQICKALK